MSNQEKLVLRLLAKYAEMVNAQFTELDHRIRVLETSSDPERLKTGDYNIPIVDAKRPAFPPVLPRQLQAILEAIEKLPD